MPKAIMDSELFPDNKILIIMKKGGKMLVGKHLSTDMEKETLLMLVDQAVEQIKSSCDED